MLLIYPFESETRMVLIERTDGGNHAGQIGLPGGKMELDETHIQTAIRETYEEIGVSLGEKDILSPLTEIYIPPSNYLVHPFVSFLMYKPVFVVNETEVKRIIELPLHLFLEESVISEKIFINSQGTEIKTPCYEIGEVQIWGATSMIISEFISMIKS